MSLGLTDYLLWKSIKHETPSASGGQENNIKQEFTDEPEILHNDKICRVCTNAAEISITEKIGDTLIISAIRMVANISIIEADYYPKFVCKDCLEELKIAYQFKKKCESSDLIFRKAISAETVSGPQSKAKYDFLHQMEQKRSIGSVTVKKDIDYDNDFSNEDMPISSLTHLGQDTTTISKKSSKKPSKGNKKPTPTKRQNNKTQNRVIKRQNKKNPKCKDDSNGLVNVDINKKKLKKLIKIHQCRRCNLTLDTKEELQRHIKEHNNTLRACPLCGKIVLHLASHERLVHTRPHKYTCHKCGKVYYSSGSLTNHMKKHKETKEYFCDHCPYRGLRKSYLVLHMRVHTGEHRYLCSICPKKFTNSSNLKKHSLVHSNQRFECSKCKKIFRQERYLKEHFDSIHLHIKYRCLICGRDFSSRRKLLRHELRIHKREKHKSFGEVQKVIVNDND